MNIKSAEPALPIKLKNNEKWGITTAITPVKKTKAQRILEEQKKTKKKKKKKKKRRGEK